MEGVPLISRPAPVKLPVPKRSWYARLEPPQLIALVYFVGILLATAALHLPGVLRDGAEMTSVDLLFTATSALTITGLVVADTGETFTRYGQYILMLLFELGGLGILSFGTLFAFVTGRRVNFSERQHLQAQISGLDTGTVVQLLRTIFAYAIGLQLIGALLLALRFVPQFGLGEGLFQAVFHAVSAFNNAGFVVVPGGMGQYVTDPLVSLTISGLVILGALGFIVQFNVVNWLQQPRQHRLTVYSLLTLVTTAALLVVGFLTVLLLESNNQATLQPLPWHGKLLASFFQSMTPRSGGFNTVDIESMRTATLMVIIALMYIGGGSGSTGGGIKTSTFAILVGSAWNMVRGRGELIAFGRRVEKDNLVRATAVTMLYTMMVMGAFFLLLLTNPHMDFTHLLFETVSAAATVGLSMNTTAHINDAGLVILSILMYLGRIGPLTFAVAFTLRSQARSGVKYPPERDILVG
ncbi:TrkH family potassium uptake protein [Deinococcus radiophilus]|uniref:Potassium transporter KtrB n=2 Tax=Deinococcus radiophilus TaxID=32062 RepID=A0A431W322_9DEIO|nr:TrkH family potassium uptake protein [Deinococcus radiophilus]RTR29828.1 potassium transporter KtrB [Deinococcus radiophilus]UFA49824.1 TrkH family potassium uptake protein [Deinococcus radiophilus]